MHKKRQPYFCGPFADFRDQELIGTHFAILLPENSEDPLLRKYYAELTHKYLLHIPAGTVCTEPLTVDLPEATTHLLVIIGKDARVEVVEILKRSHIRHVVELFVEDNASVNFVSVQTADRGTGVWIAQRSCVGAGAEVHWKNVTLGGEKVQQDLRSRLTGRKSVSSVDWIFYAKGAETQMLRVQNIFDAPEGGGEITIQGVAEECAHTTARGMIEITPQGSGADTYLTATMLMLDPTAKVDAIPGLEIRTNDVKASHSATVTNVSEEDLFYLASRGIALREGRRMIIEGFLGALIERFPGGKTRERVRREIARKYESS